MKVVVLLSRQVISIVYSLVVGLVIGQVMGTHWGNGVLIVAAIYFAVGVTNINGFGNAMPYVVNDSTNNNATDSSGLRATMDMNTLIKDAEKDAPKKASKWRPTARLFNFKDLFLRRSGLELILAGILSFLIGLSTYRAYF